VSRAAAASRAQGLLVLLVGNGPRLIEVLEAVAPRAEHLLGVVEPLGDVPAEGLAEERGQPLPQARVEQLGIDGGLLVEMGRVGRAVAPPGKRPGRQLVQGDGRGVALGVEVPAGRLSQGQKRVEIPGGARPDVVRGRPRQGEIEEHHMQRVPPADHPHGDVVGLDVPMGDPLLLEVVQHVEQVHAEALEVIDLEPALLAQPLAECLDAVLVLVDQHRAHEEAGVLSDDDLLAELDDMLVPELGEDLGLVPDAGILLGVAGGLEHIVLAVALDQQRDRAGPAGRFSRRRWLTNERGVVILAA
jgi:hypothetical protein